MLNPRVINIQMFIGTPLPPHTDGAIVDTRSDIIARLLTGSSVSLHFAQLPCRHLWFGVNSGGRVGLSRLGPKWVMLKGKSAVKNWKIWVRFTIWLVCQTGDLHFSKYQTRLSIKKFPRFRHSTAVGRDRSNMLQKGLGMLTTVINLHFICSVHVCFSNYSNS